jgi:hypothetical protein
MYLHESDRTEGFIPDVRQPEVSKSVGADTSDKGSAVDEKSRPYSSWDEFYQHQREMWAVQRAHDAERSNGGCVACSTAQPSTPVQTVPVSLFDFGSRVAGEIMSNEPWTDVEIEVALDSGSVVHVASEADTPCYVLDDSAAAKPCEEFIVGDGGTMKNYGQKTLNLKSEKGQFSSVFQIAAVHRPLMSVGRICDNGNSVTFTHDKAIVRGRDGNDICVFTRNGGGLYTAKLKLTAPFGRPGK